MEGTVDSLLSLELVCARCDDGGRELWVFEGQKSEFIHDAAGA